MGVKFIGKSAFDAVYDANVDRVYRTALHYSENHHVAEEITQTVFMKLYENMENINMEAVPKWLQTCAKHMAFNYIRQSKHEVLTDEIVEEFDKQVQGDSIEDEFLQKLKKKENYEFLEEMLADLYCANEKWYYAWTITRILKKPEKEVAQIMGISYDNLRQILSRTNKWIEKHYEEQYDHLNKA